MNKKMKVLQDLVPGCSRILGRAGMLDEIINYVQSLQRQVEVIETYLPCKFCVRYFIKWNLITCSSCQ